MRIWGPLIVVALACGACSPRAARREPPEAPAARLLRADALVDRGCYLCLGDALGLYRDLLAGGFQPAVVRDRIFRASTLLAVREREVGIVPAVTGSETPPTAGAGGALYAEVAAAVPWRTRDVTSAFPDVEVGVFASLPRWRQELRETADTGDVLAAYLLVALSCSYAQPGFSPSEFAGYAAAHPASLGIAFRVASCRPPNEEALRDVVRREPRFVEADFLLGEVCARTGRAGEAEQYYRRVLEVLPRLVAGPIALGDLLAGGEEFEEALGLYERALEVVPDHRQALLGKVKCLSNLERHQEALDVCDTMIRLGTWYLGPARYWRAWNFHALRELERAWGEIDAAKFYLQNADVFELSGVIAFERGDLARARADMDEALRYNKNMCRPPFYLGRVQMETQEWAGAAARFVQAAACYEEGARATARKMAEMERSTLADARKARLRARYEDQIAAGERAAALSAYDAAVNYANAGAIGRAIELAERALRDDRVNAQARDLLAKLRKRWGSAPEF